MRVLVVEPGPNYSVQDVHRGLVNGFRANGCTVADCKFSDALTLMARAYIKGDNGDYRIAFPDQVEALHMAAKWVAAAWWEFDPDLVVITMGSWLHPYMWPLFRQRRAHTVLWCTESPYEDGRQLRQAPLVHTVVLNDPLNLDRFRTVNPDTHYFPHSYDPDLHRPGPGRDDWRCDVAFAGTGFESRIAFTEAVDWSGIDLRLAGMWAGLDVASPLRGALLGPANECIDNADTVRLYQSCKASWNLYRREAHDGDTAEGVAVGPREVELAATGTFFLRDPRPEGDALFPMLPTFDGPDDFGDRLRWWLAHDDARDEAAAKARVAVADHTFEASTARLLRLVDARVPA